MNSGASLVAQTVERLPTMRETRVRSLGWEDPLEKELATHSSTLAWKIPWNEEPGRLQSMGSQRVGHNWATSLHFKWTAVSLYLFEILISIILLTPSCATLVILTVEYIGCNRKIENFSKWNINNKLWKNSCKITE